MKKSLILVGMLSIGYAYAQEGSVGINTETPKATLEIVPNATNLAGTTNEGIIIPKLTKARVVAIAADKLVEGTKVYVTDEVTAADAQFIGTGKGFYFYNGTKWVKQLTSDTDTNSELWAQRDNAGVTETYLKPADTDGNKYQYSNKGILSNLGKVTREDSRWVVSGDYGYTEGEVPNAKLTSSDVLPLNSTIGNKANLNVFKFGKNLNIVREAHAGQGVMAGKKSYVGQRSDIGAIDVTSNIASIAALSGRAYAFTSANTVGSVTAVDGEAIAGSDTHKTLTVTDVAGGNFTGRNFANTTNLVGVKSVTHNYGNATNIIGGRFDASSTNSHIPLGIENPTATVTTLRGIQTSAGNRPNSTTTTIAGAFISSNLMDSSKATNVMTVDARGYIQTGSTVENLSNIYSYVRGFGAANVTNLYGFRFDTLFHRDFNAENMYGLYLANVDKGRTLNYAIYTNRGIVHIGDKLGVGTETPTQRIEANGNILANGGGLMSSISSAVGGYLQLENPSKTDTGAVGRWRIYNMTNSSEYKYVPGLHFWAYGADGTNLSSKMVITDAGNVGIGFDSNATTSTQTNEKLEVNGNVKAKAFLGANGATIFPDYVFQKYYTGTSSIKSDYSFKTLSQVEAFVKTNGHLPGYKSAETIKAQGYVDLMETQLTNVEKIEELYLHLMEKDKEVKTLQSRNEQLETKNQELESRLERLEKLIK